MSRLVTVLSQAYSNIQLHHIVHILLIHTTLYKVGLTFNINNMSLFSYIKGGCYICYIGFFLKYFMVIRKS